MHTDSWHHLQELVPAQENGLEIIKVAAEWLRPEKLLYPCS